jgi:hypothetical protein
MSNLQTLSWHQNDPVRAGNYLLAAFKIGGLVNRLSWCLEQFLLLGTARQKSELDRVWRCLSDDVLDAVPHITSGVKLQRLILDQYSIWEQEISTESFAIYWHEQLPQVLRELAETDMKNRSFASELSETLKSFLADASYASHTVRQAVETELSPFSEIGAAFLLGDTFDKGFRPPNVHRYSYRQQENPLYNGSLPRRRGFGADASQSPLPPRYILGKVNCRPGQLYPPDQWARLVDAIGVRLGLASRLEDLQAANDALTRVERLDVLRSMRRHYVQGLTELASRLTISEQTAPTSTDLGEVRNGRTESQWPKGITFHEENTVTLGTDTYTEINDRAFRLLKLVAEANGEVVSKETICKEIKGMNGENTIANTCKKLPKALQDCLKGNRGRVGGRSYVLRKQK